MALLLVGAIFVCGVFCALGMPMWVAAVLAVFWLPTGFSVVRAIRKTGTVQDELLYADSLGTDDVLVQMWVEVDGAIFGSDRGILWRDESGLCFHGHRSWFRIAPGEWAIGARQYRAIPRELDLYANMIRLDLLSEPRPLRLGLRVIADQHGFRTDAEGMRRMRDKVLPGAASSHAAKLPTQLPPLHPDSAFRTTVPDGPFRPSEMLEATVGVLTLVGAAVYQSFLLLMLTVFLLADAFRPAASTLRAHMRRERARQG